mmetsp:Transcript_98382/g.175168  ORF Transcript_98382/g.175168 Transcript_98382/m.175168 type:complete len:157 (+) Transcript_98382:36-506(+)
MSETDLAPVAPTVVGQANFGDDCKSNGKHPVQSFEVNGTDKMNAAFREQSSEVASPAQRLPTNLNNPEDVPDALPQGKVKLFAFLLVFFVWWGSWGAMDDLFSLMLDDHVGVQIVLKLGLSAIAVWLLRRLARRYRRYAMIQEMDEIVNDGEEDLV